MRPLASESFGPQCCAVVLPIAPSSRRAPFRMSAVVPELRALLESAGHDEHDRAWSDFLDTYSRLLLHVAHAVARDHDDVMDAYAHVLEELRADGFARLRSFAAD